MYNWYDKLIGGCFIPTVYLLNSLPLMNALLVAYVYVNALKFIPMVHTFIRKFTLSLVFTIFMEQHTRGG